MAIRQELVDSGIFDEIPRRRFPEKAIREVHDGDFVDYLKAVCEKLSPERRPKDLYYRAGYYCIDTFTPLYHNAFEAARNAVDIALTGAESNKRNYDYDRHEHSGNPVGDGLDGNLRTLRFLNEFYDLTQEGVPSYLGGAYFQRALTRRWRWIHPPSSRRFKVIFFF